MTPDSRFARALDEHRAALASFASAVAALEPGAWTRPRAEGKWTPAEVTEHLRLSYGAFLQEIRGGAAMRMRVFGVRRRLLRWLVLPHILFHRTFPLRAVSPRELRPEDPGLPPGEAVARLLALAAEAEREIDAARGRPDAVLTHPYFGAIDLTRGLRFAAVHVEHHVRQVLSAAPPPAP
jgi:hypothetical protein